MKFVGILVEFIIIFLLFSYIDDKNIIPVALLILAHSAFNYLRGRDKGYSHGYAKGYTTGRLISMERRNKLNESIR